MMGRPSRADLLRLGEKFPREVAGALRGGRVCLHFGEREGKSQSSLARDAKFRCARPSGVP